jgi:site-specific DNA recombinase
VKRAILYIRVSSKEQAAGGYSIEGQQEIGIKYITEQGWQLVEVFAERGESARTAKRPEYKRMLAFLEEDRTIDYVVIWKLDRLIRNLEDYADMRAYLRKLGSRLISIMEGFEDTPAGRMIEGILAWNHSGRREGPAAGVA